MKKYIQTDELQSMIDWKNLMSMPRSAGGHDDQMKGLFKNAEIIGHWNEGDYQGEVATCVKLENGKYAIYNDYYGSCSGCDSWEDATDEEVKAMCINLANGAYVFESIEDVKEYLENDPEGSWNDCAKHLLDEILENESKKILDKVKSFEDACNILGLDPKQLPEVSLLPEKDQRTIIAFYKLTVIIRALNEGWEPNWSDWNEYKYFNWFYLDSSGFGYADTTNAATSTTSARLGSRLCFKNAALARYAREIPAIRDLYFEYLFIELPKNYGK